MKNWSTFLTSSGINLHESFFRAGAVDVILRAAPPLRRHRTAAGKQMSERERRRVWRYLRVAAGSRLSSHVAAAALPLPEDPFPYWSGAEGGAGAAGGRRAAVPGARNFQKYLQSE